MRRKRLTSTNWWKRKSSKWLRISSGKNNKNNNMIMNTRMKNKLRTKDYPSILLIISEVFYLFFYWLNYLSEINDEWIISDWLNEVNLFKVMCFNTNFTCNKSKALTVINIKWPNFYFTSKKSLYLINISKPFHIDQQKEKCFKKGNTLLGFRLLSTKKISIFSTFIKMASKTMALRESSYWDWTANKSKRLKS